MWISVWSIGITLYSLPNLTHGDNTLDRANSIFDTHRVPAPFEEGVRQYYSQELRDLVMKCCEYRPSDRPSPDELLGTIRRLTGEGGPRKAATGLREADADDRRFFKHALILPREKWQLGTAASDEPAKKLPLPEFPNRRPRKDPKGDDDSDSDSSSDDSFGGKSGDEAVFDPDALKEREEKRDKAKKQREARLEAARENPRRGGRRGAQDGATVP